MMNKNQIGEMFASTLRRPPTLAECRDHRARQLDGLWTALTVYDPQQRGEAYLASLLRAHGFAFDFDDAQSGG